MPTEAQVLFHPNDGLASEWSSYVNYFSLEMCCRCRRWRMYKRYDFFLHRLALHFQWHRHIFCSNDDCKQMMPMMCTLPNIGRMLPIVHHTFGANCVRTSSDVSFLDIITFFIAFAYTFSVFVCGCSIPSYLWPHGKKLLPHALIYH